MGSQNSAVDSLLLQVKGLGQSADDPIVFLMNHSQLTPLPKVFFFVY